jgi:HK97 gp10 family phage protein
MNIEFNTDDFDKKIKEVEKKIPKIAKKMLSAALGKAKTDTKRKARSMFPGGTGRLNKSINTTVFDDWRGALTTKKKSRKDSGWYANFLEKGATRTAKNGKYLTFKINGEWKKARSTTVPPRPFLRPTFDSYFVNNGGEKARKIMDDKLQQEISKIDKDDE